MDYKNKQYFELLFHKKSLSSKEMAEKFSVHVDTIRRWRRKHDIGTKRERKRKTLPSKEKLYEWYVKKRMSYREIMKKIGYNNTRIVKELLSEHNIEIRKGSDAIKTQWEDNPERRNKQSEFAKNKFKGNTERRLNEKRIKTKCKEKDFHFIERIIKKGYSIIKYKCKKCGHEDTKHMKSFNSTGCPNCNISKGENKIETFLKDNNIIFTREHKFEDCKHINKLRFDFAIFVNSKLNCLIEYQGRQHFEVVDIFGGEKGLEGRKKRDNIKRYYCKSKDIPLIEIQYWNFDIIENILVRKLGDTDKISEEGYKDNLSLF